MITWREISQMLKIFLGLASVTTQSYSPCPRQLILKKKKRVLMKELEDAYKEQGNDPNFQEEISVWDVTLEDGLNAS